MLKTKEEIVDWLDKILIEKYTMKWHVLYLQHAWPAVD